jgi:hypothetical protein
VADFEGHPFKLAFPSLVIEQQLESCGWIAAACNNAITSLKQGSDNTQAQASTTTCDENGFHDND